MKRRVTHLAKKFIPSEPAEPRDPRYLLGTAHFSVNNVCEKKKEKNKSDDKTEDMKNNLRSFNCKKIMREKL